MATRSQRTQQRQSDIVGVALAHFNAKGVEHTAVGDICLQAGVSIGSLYHHYGSKEGLASAVYCQGVAQFQQAYLQALDPPGNARQVLAALVQAHVGWVRREPAWARFLLHGRAQALTPAGEQTLQERNAAFEARLGQWFAQQVAAGALRKLPRLAYVALLVGPCQEWTRAYLASPEPDAEPDICADLADCIWHALRTPTPEAP